MLGPEDELEALCRLKAGMDHAASEDEARIETLLKSAVPHSSGALLLPSSVTHAVLIDIDNCGNVFSSPLAIDAIPPTLALLIFGGPELPKVPLESVRALSAMVHQNRFHIIQTRASAAKAADFALALYSGMLHLSARPNVEFVIVSKDVGLDNIVVQLFELGRKTRRIIVGSLQAVVASCRTTMVEAIEFVPRATSPQLSPRGNGKEAPVPSSSFFGRGASGYVSAPDVHHRTSLPGVAPIGASRQKPTVNPPPGFAPMTYAGRSLTVDTSVFSRNSLDGMSTATESLPQDDSRTWQPQATGSSWADVTRVRMANPLHVPSTPASTPVPAPAASTAAAGPAGTAASIGSAANPAAAAAAVVPSSEEGESSSDQEGASTLVGQVLPLTAPNALAAMTTRFYAKGYGGVAQLKADVLVTMERLSDPYDFALQVIIELKLKPFNKKRGHFRVFPKLLLRCLALQNAALLTERNKQLAREVLTVLQNNAFGKKTINKMKSIFQMERTDASGQPMQHSHTQHMHNQQHAPPSHVRSPSRDDTPPLEVSRPPGFEAFQMNTGVNPLWALNS